MSNNITYLKKYIENNLNEKDGGRWEYIIHPEIRDIINDLNEGESEIFSEEILNWDEKVLYHLADEIIFSENKFIGKSYLYCLIFLETNDKENFDYLIQNLFACLNDINIESTPLDFFLKMKERIKLNYKVENEEEDLLFKFLNETIKEKTKNNSNYR